MPPRRLQRGNERRRALDGREALRRPRELRGEKRHESALELDQLPFIRPPAAVLRPEPARDGAIGDVRRVGPIEGSAVETKNLRRSAQIALIVDRIGRGQCAVDVENRELSRKNTPS